jgi:hypothetical protein
MEEIKELSAENKPWVMTEIALTGMGRDDS